MIDSLSSSTTSYHNDEWLSVISLLQWYTVCCTRHDAGRTCQYMVLVDRGFQQWLQMGPRPSSEVRNSTIGFKSLLPTTLTATTTNWAKSKTFTMALNEKDIGSMCMHGGLQDPEQPEPVHHSSNETGEASSGFSVWFSLSGNAVYTNLELGRRGWISWVSRGSAHGGVSWRRESVHSQSSTLVDLK